MKIFIFFMSVILLVNAYYTISNENEHGSNGKHCHQHKETTQFPECYWRQCKEESKMEKEDMERFKSHDFSRPHKKMKCFIKCIMEKMGLIKDEEFIDRNILKVLVQNYGSEELRTKIRNCKGGCRGLRRCEAAFKFYVCLLKNIDSSDDFLKFKELKQEK